MEFMAKVDEKTHLRNLLQTILGLAVMISEETPHDVFCYYYPHIPSLDVQFHKDGWKDGEGYTLMRMCNMKESKLLDCINWLKEIYFEAKGEKNGCLELSFAPDVVNQ